MNDRLRVTYLRCSMTLIQWQGLTVLTDPWYGNNLRGLPCFYAPPIALDQLPPIDAVLASHLHPDHFDVKAVRFLAARNPRMAVFAPPGVVEKLGPGHAGEVHELQWWQSRALGPLELIAAEAHHSGYEINAVIRGPGGSLFFGGDSRYSPAFNLTAQRLGPCDVALLPIGGTRVFGRRIVMNPQDAAAAAHDLGARYAIPIHEGGIWASLPPLSLHPGRPRHLREIAARPDSKFEAIVLEPGASAEFAPGEKGLTFVAQAAAQ
ncbi:MAG: MBL fold metallo-hydrolase [Candidatus Alcyoniella australis]|nr:MBL fold metallo-hydrolase [Candidatus Alcyoniella australis]